MHELNDPADPPAEPHTPGEWARSLLETPAAAARTPTQTYLALLKAKHGLASDGKTATFLNTHRTTVRRWSLGESTLNKAWAIRFATLLELDPEQVMADLGHASR